LFCSPTALRGSWPLLLAFISFMLVFSLSVGVLVHGYVTDVNTLVDHKQSCVRVDNREPP
jgi:hypothetical protein